MFRMIVPDAAAPGELVPVTYIILPTVDENARRTAGRPAAE